MKEWQTDEVNSAMETKHPPTFYSEQRGALPRLLAEGAVNIFIKRPTTKAQTIILQANALRSQKDRFPASSLDP